MKLTIEQAFMLRFLLENSNLDGHEYRKLHTALNTEIESLKHPKRKEIKDGMFHTIGRFGK